MPKILAFAGSRRKGSLNKKLVAVAAQGARNHGVEVTLVDLDDYPMPLFDEDLERRDGLPSNALKFKKLMLEHDGLLLASPEYNSAFSPLLKNTIDWASRAESDDEPSLNVFRGKTAVIMATSPGGLGGLRGLVFLRMLLGNLGITVLPLQLAVPRGGAAFGDDGQLVDEKQQRAVLKLGETLAAALD